MGMAEPARREERVLRYRDERLMCKRMQVDVDSGSERVNWSHLGCASQNGHFGNQALWFEKWLGWLYIPGACYSSRGPASCLPAARGCCLACIATAAVGRGPRKQGCRIGAHAGLAAAAPAAGAARPPAKALVLVAGPLLRPRPLPAPAGSLPPVSSAPLPPLLRLLASVPLPSSPGSLERRSERLKS